VVPALQAIFGGVYLWWWETSPLASGRPQRGEFLLNDGASSTGRCNTIQRIDSSMLVRENHLFGCTRPKPSLGSLPACVTLASDVGFGFRRWVGSNFVLHRPVELAAFIRHLPGSVVNANSIWLAPSEHENPNHVSERCVWAPPPTTFVRPSATCSRLLGLRGDAWTSETELGSSWLLTSWTSG
jgi:hypothetical protein